MTNLPDKCPIWGVEFGARVATPNECGSIDVFSPRTGGNFSTNSSTLSRFSEISNRQKAKLTTWLINRRRQGEEWPHVSNDVIDSIIRASALPVYVRADRLLKYLSEETIEFGSPLRAPFKSYMAWAVSESVGESEVQFLRRFLDERGWIMRSTYWSGLDTALTVDGLARVEQLAINVDLSQAFVAMWIDPAMDSAYTEGFKPAIETCGYEAMRIDQKPDVNKLDDEIIAEIKRSRFVVADFTQDSRGARGSVYFEAGFAIGIGLPVIFSCREDCVNDLHFDIRQYAHLTWDTPANLQRSLVSRIQARINAGPMTTA